MRMSFGFRWYRCRLHDRSSIIEPDWAKIPEAKRAEVRARWQERNAEVGETSEVLLWGPQISFFARLPYYTVTVLDTDPPA